MRSVILDNNLAIVTGRDGTFLVNLNDTFIGQSMAIYGEYSFEESAFLKRLIRPGDTVVEVGANIGSQTIGLAKAVGRQGKVYAFEPQRACFALLQAQIALNQAHNIHAFNEGLGRARERLWIVPTGDTGPHNSGGVSLTSDRNPAAEAVEVTTLDERLAGIPCALLKIDVEGMEEEVIRGGSTLIRTCRPILYVENDRMEKSKALIALIIELGYRLWWHKPKLYTRENFFNVTENIFGKTISLNMVCATEPHEAMTGLVEIKSADAPHPLAPPLPPQSYAITGNWKT